jgi:dephospho-CoA kinase
MLVIGLTGGIGCGKSTVTQLFAQYGIDIIDADVIAHKITQPGTPAFAKIVAHFGKKILRDQHLDRRQLRDIIFQQAPEKRWLEALLHPLIINLIKQQISKAKPPYCIVAMPLLLESPRVDFIQRILVVDIPVEQQITRVMQRDNISAAQVQAVMQQQVSRELRLQRADDVLDNSGSLEQLTQQIAKLHQRYVDLSVRA